MARKMLLVRVDLAGIGVVRGGTEATVGRGRRRAAHHADALNHHLRRALPVTQVQLDERGNFSARQHPGETDTAGASGPDSEEGRPWVWSSCAPAFRWRIAAIVGPRPLATATAVVAAPTARGAGLPAFFRDGCTC